MCFHPLTWITDFAVTLHCLNHTQPPIELLNHTQSSLNIKMTFFSEIIMILIKNHCLDRCVIWNIDCAVASHEICMIHTPYTLELTFSDFAFREHLSLLLFAPSVLRLQIKKMSGESIRNISVQWHLLVRCWWFVCDLPVLPSVGVIILWLQLTRFLRALLWIWSVYIFCSEYQKGLCLFCSQFGL